VARGSDDHGRNGQDDAIERAVHSDLSEGEMDLVERQNMKRPGSRRQMRFSFADQWGVMTRPGDRFTSGGSGSIFSARTCAVNLCASEMRSTSTAIASTA